MLDDFNCPAIDHKRRGQEKSVGVTTLFIEKRQETSLHKEGG